MKENVLGPSSRLAWSEYRLNGTFCGLYNSTQESLVSEEVPAGSEQFQFDVGLFSSSLMTIIPGDSGGGPNVPGTGGGVSGAHR